MIISLGSSGQAYKGTKAFSHILKMGCGSNPVAEKTGLAKTLYGIESKELKKEGVSLFVGIPQGT